MRCAGGFASWTSVVLTIVSKLGAMYACWVAGAQARRNAHGAKRRERRMRKLYCTADTSRHGVAADRSHSKDCTRAVNACHPARSEGSASTCREDQRA